MLEQVETAYETVFARVSADDQFFADLELAYGKFMGRTDQKVTPRQVKTAQRLLRDACRKAMQEAKNRQRDTGLGVSQDP